MTVSWRWSCEADMATTKDYLDYVLERLPEPEAARCRKMFGEYMVYLNDRPVLLVCDNTVFVKRLPELADLMKSAPTGVPYSGSKEHYILDMDDTERAAAVLAVLSVSRRCRSPEKRKDNHGNQTWKRK